MAWNRKAAAALAGLMAVSVCLGGCSGAKLDGSKTVITVGDEKVSLGIANFSAKLMQAQYETYYKAYLGDDMWNVSYDGEKTYEESVKESVLDTVESYILLRQHADEYGVSLSDSDIALAEQYAAQFISDNTAKTLERMTADKATVTEYFELGTYYQRMYSAIIKNVDTNVSDEEAAQKKVKYILVNALRYTNDEGETVEYTDDEKADREALAKDILEQAKAGADLDEIANVNDLTASEGTFGNGLSSTVPSAVQEACENLKEGECADLITVDAGYYVAVLTSEFDREATDNQKTTILSQRESDLFETTVQEWKDATEITVDENVWADVNFTAPLTIVSAATAE